MYEILLDFVYICTMNTIFLIGYMGCGKTTLGTALARYMNLPFVDLDDYIEERCEATVKEIFAQAGESGFREIEKRCLEEVAHQPGGAIVACGGGTPCQSGNMQLMNNCGLTIWLTTSVQRIADRLMLPEQKAKRPLIASMDDGEILAYVEQHLAQREPYYSEAQLTFDSTRLESVQEIDNSAQELALLLKGMD